MVLEWRRARLVTAPASLEQQEASRWLSPSRLMAMASRPAVRTFVEPAFRR
jgi:hypothetical protein